MVLSSLMMVTLPEKKSKNVLIVLIIMNYKQKGSLCLNLAYLFSIFAVLSVIIWLIIY